MTEPPCGEFVLGIDLGTNSVGWAMVGLADGEPAKLLRAGVRVFEAGMEGDIESGQEQSKNLKRREARSHRRQLWRRARRLTKVFNLLQRANLLPPTEDVPAEFRKAPAWGKPFAGWLATDQSEARQDYLNWLDQRILDSPWFTDTHPVCTIPKNERTPEQQLESHRLKQLVPYILRAAALDERLEPYLLGRALYHLAQRRGFLSNRLKPAKKEDDEGKVKKGISELRKAMEETHARTLGEHLAHVSPTERRIRGRWTARSMYEEEFEKIWAAQAAHHPTLLNDDRRKQISGALFFQRPLWFDPDTIGRCDLEPGERRAPAYLLTAQRFRLLQKVNDLQIEEPGKVSRYLTPEQRAKLSDALELQGDLAFHRDRKANGRVRPSVRTLLGLPKNVSFNLQRGGEEKMPGNRTTSAFYAVFGERWLEMSAEEHNQAILDVLSIRKPEALKRRALGYWKLHEPAADKFCEISLEPDYMSLSRKAIEKLLPLLEQGIPLATARLELYRDKSEARGGLTHLPPVEVASDRTRLEEWLERTKALQPGAQLPDTVAAIRNPAVMRSLTELRKVVNAVVRRYGKPTYIRIELARQLKKSKKQRAGLSEINRRNEKARARAAEEIIKGDVGLKEPKPEDKRKYLLAEECHWHCPYTGKTISMQALFGPEPQFDIEHIIPFTRSMDNSFQNLTLCYVPENRSVKGNKTPNEAYSGDPERYQAILDRVKKFTGERAMVSAKLKRFTMSEEELEDFLKVFRNRQLNDTAYAARLATRYVSLLYGGLADAQHEQRVFAPSGQTTAYFRNLWKLNSILNDGPTTEGGRFEKSRGDHRHHAVDALVIALTDAGMVKRLSDAAQRASSAGRRRFATLEGPWPKFVETVREAIYSIVVSHRVSKKVSGALHEEMIYSSPRADGSVRVRKPLAELTKKEVEGIADAGVKALVLAKLAGGDPKKVFASEENLPCFQTSDGRRIPIRRVRINKAVPVFTLGDGRTLRHVTSDSNHHVEIYAEIDENGNEGRWDGEVVTMHEAYQRVKAGRPLVQRDHGPFAKFKFPLSPGEVIECDGGRGQRALWVSRGVASYESGPRLLLVPVSDARQKKEMLRSGSFWSPFVNPLRKLNPRKVIVSPLGEVSEAHD
jgi:CRISPR-associated endonuclease Csn1